MKNLPKVTLVLTKTASRKLRLLMSQSDNALKVALALKKKKEGNDAPNR